MLEREAVRGMFRIHVLSLLLGSVCLLLHTIDIAHDLALGAVSRANLSALTGSHLQLRLTTVRVFRPNETCPTTMLRSLPALPY